MKIVVITPESSEPREHAVLGALFAAGLERCHVRKPAWSREKLAAWLRDVAPARRARLVLHQHHDLAAEFGCGGVHFKDAPLLEGRARPLGAPSAFAGQTGRSHLSQSRSCHDLATLGAALGRCDSVFLSPMFSSISKPGYAPTLDLPLVTARLARRSADDRRTAVIALGGITPANAARCVDLGFDGVAVLGALWQSPDPLKVFNELQNAVEAHVA